ncbi:hypothetical protein [Planctobacterium marinum]|uniref:hypothetical protein n=1 Tax=Planctobacterium marinum TaxID=1631968 RepID=UPI0030C66396
MPIILSLLKCLKSRLKTERAPAINFGIGVETLFFDSYLAQNRIVSINKFQSNQWVEVELKNKLKKIKKT